MARTIGCDSVVGIETNPITGIIFRKLGMTEVSSHKLGDYFKDFEHPSIKGYYMKF